MRAAKEYGFGRVAKLLPSASEILAAEQEADNYKQEATVNQPDDKGGNDAQNNDPDDL
jgi:hypothetical protein